LFRGSHMPLRVQLGRSHCRGPTVEVADCFKQSREQAITSPGLGPSERFEFKTEGVRGVE